MKEIFMEETPQEAAVERLYSLKKSSHGSWSHEQNGTLSPKNVGRTKDDGITRVLPSLSTRGEMFSLLSLRIHPSCCPALVNVTAQE